MSFMTVKIFENQLADWWGAPYAVATDCCTHAIELCLRLKEFDNVGVPAHTYVSVPQTLEKLGLNWHFTDSEWQEYYELENTNIVDSAVYWKPGGYLKGKLQCLSFQFKKPLNLGRGGAILCEDLDTYLKLKAMSYDGRLGDQPWAEQDIQLWGYHYYMTPETAQAGIDKLPQSMTRHTKTWSYQDYPDLRNFLLFRRKFS